MQTTTSFNPSFHIRGANTLDLSHHSVDGLGVTRRDAEIWAARQGVEMFIFFEGKVEDVDPSLANEPMTEAGENYYEWL